MTYRYIPDDRAPVHKLRPLHTVTQGGELVKYYFCTGIVYMRRVTHKYGKRAVLWFMQDYVKNATIPDGKL